MNLTSQDLQLIKDLHDFGEPLPPKYKLLLFADAPEVGLIWQGKTSEVASVVLLFQSIEQIDEPLGEAGPQQLGLFTVTRPYGPH
jgi:adenine-specific DNA-methyltransferase